MLEELQPLFSDDIKNSIDNNCLILPNNLCNLSNLPYRHNDYLVWVYLAGVVFTQMFGMLFQEYSSFMSSKTALKVRALLTTIIYEKCLSLSTSSIHKNPTGKIINFVAGDLMTLEFYFQRFHFAWSSILIIIIVFILVFFLMGYSVFICIFISLMIFFVVIVISFLNYYVRKKYIIYGDKRIEEMNEIFLGMKIIKLFAWEKAYKKRVLKTRRTQVILLRILFFIVSLMNCFIVIAVPITLFGGITSYYLMHDELDPVLILSALAYVSLLRFSITFAPEILTQFFTAAISFKRIQTFLREEEVRIRDRGLVVESENIIDIKEAHFQWHSLQQKSEKEMNNEKQYLLKDIDIKEKKKGEIYVSSLEASKRSLTIVCGPVGCGKSSLLYGILNEMNLSSGDIDISGSIAFSGQEAWIINATLLDNVLFGNVLNESLFKLCVSVCALGRDLEILDGGRMIELGEKGLARACYSNSDVYLLDDPLAAVDAHVAKFNECIKGYLKEKTVILTTHQIQFCPFADNIILMGNGEIVEQGSFKELMSKKGEFYTLYKENFGSSEKEEKDEKDEKKILVEEQKIEDEEIKKPEKEIEVGDKKKIIQKEERVVGGGINFNSINAYIKNSGGYCMSLFLLFILIIACGEYYVNDFWMANMSQGIYWQEKYGDYYNTTYCSYITNDTEVISYIDSDLCNVSGYFIDDEIYNYTVSSSLVEIFWVPNFKNETIIKSGLTIPEMFYVFAGLVFIMPLLYLFLGLFSFSIFINTSQRLFRKAVTRIFRSPLGFFESNPLGRIMSRFSTDVRVLDVELSFYLFLGLLIFFTLICCLILIAITTYGLLLIFIVILFFIFFLFFQFYRRTSRELKRIEAIARSPLFSTFTEMLNGGIATVRAFRMQNQFIHKNRKKINSFNRCHFLILSATRWVTIYLNMIGYILIIVTSIISITLNFYLNQYFHIPVTILNLGITKAVITTHLFCMSAFYIIETEVRFNSIERLEYYSSKIPVEKKLSASKKMKQKKWKVSNGKIEFKKFCFRYREELPLVLNNVDFVINPKEKIGIIGRTGAGKSSIMVALMRLVEPSSGKILIDGKDITKLSLKNLRKNISIIPQDPVLFSGTIKVFPILRYSLFKEQSRNSRFILIDPFNWYPDEVIIDRIRKANLENVILKDVNGLYARVEANGIYLKNLLFFKGKNFSVGERQLLCLCRALLKDSSILLLDECTASVDMDSDAIIQNTIRKDFDATIITIAHRLSTVVDYDRIMVLDNGQVKEFDSPKNLIKKKEDSLFYSLIMETTEPNHLLNKILNKE